jgi:lipopolysaccharide heptosyltransferase II
MMPDFHRILLIKPSSLGDIVHALPTVASLRSIFPAAHLAWLVKREWAGLVERAEGVDAVWPVDPGIVGWLSRVPGLRAEGFDLVVDLQGLLRSGVMAWLSGSPARIGFSSGREGSPLFYSQRVAVPTPDMHAVDRYLLVAVALGAAAGLTPAFRFRPLPGDEQQLGALLRDHGLSPDIPWIAMNVSARWPTKRWPLEYFAQAADRLQHDGAGRVVLFGGPGDRIQVDAVKRAMRTEPVDLTGETPVGLLPALLKSAAVLVSNDSGPMHVAAAVGTPVVALFGPTNPVRTGPYGAGQVVLTHDVPCRPCYSRRCVNSVERECLVSIIPGQIVQAVHEQVTRRLAHR